MISSTASVQDKRAYLAELLQRKGGRPKSFRLSFAQERLWFLDRFESGSSAYNMPGVVRIAGALNTTILESAVNEVIRRHDILRTTFTEAEDGPIQCVHPWRHVPLSVISLTAADEANRERDLRRYIERICGAPFDLEKGPLLRISIVRLAPEEHVIISVFHHIICDGGSTGIFFQEIQKFYGALTSGQAADITKLSLQYGDFAQWQRNNAGDLQGIADVEFWKKHLAEAPPILPFPTDNARPPIQTYAGASLHFLIEPEIRASLESLARESESTLFMVLFSAFAVLLFRYTTADDLVVGTTIANRGRKELEPLIGLFVNTVALRVRLSSDLTFRQVVQCVRKTAIGAYAHQDMPFERIVHELQIPRQMSHSPVFQVMFDFNSSLPEIKVAGLEFKPMDSLNATSKFDFTISMEDTGKDLVGLLEYNTDLFERETMTGLLNYWQKLLRWAVGRADTALSDLPFLTEAEERRMADLECEATLNF